jgi:ribosome-binding protein aMBF1 (putative translation factor)
VTRTRDALKILDHMIGDDPELRRMIAEEGVKFEVSQLVYDARTAAGLTQGQLARKIGTTQSVISRLEDADYRGHSLTMLQRIAEALNLHLIVRLAPKRESRKRA